jgi:hypothetical protein
MRLKVCCFILTSMTMAFPSKSLGQDCGQPPNNTTVTRDLIEGIRSLACTASQAGGSLNAVVEDIPFGAKFDQSQKQCSSLEQSRQEATNTISQYLSTPDSLLVAECGYRSCMLLKTGASDQTLDAFYSICSGAGKPSVAADFAIENRYLQITTPAAGGTGTASRMLVVKSSPQTTFKVSKIVSYAAGVKMNLTLPAQTIHQGLNKVPVEITYPAKRADASLPVDFKLFLNGDQAEVDGTLLITKDIHCSKACKSCQIVGDKPICSLCQSKVPDGGYSLSVPGATALNTICENMPRGDYKLSVSGYVLPGFTTQGNTQCGAPNSNVDWNVVMSAVADVVPPKSSGYSATKILSPTQLVSIEGTGAVPNDGRVSAHIEGSDVWCWPDTHGHILNLTKDLTLSIEAQSSSGQTRK